METRNSELHILFIVNTIVFKNNSAVVDRAKIYNLLDKVENDKMYCYHNRLVRISYYKVFRKISFLRFIFSMRETRDLILGI